MEYCIYDKVGIINLIFIMRMFLEHIYSIFFSSLEKVGLGQVKMCGLFPLSFKYLRVFCHGFCKYMY